MIENPDATTPLVAKLTELSERQRTLLTEQERLMERRARWQQAQRRINHIEQWCAKVSNKLHHLAYAEKRLALEALGVKAWISPPGHEPRYVITMALDPDVAQEFHRRRRLRRWKQQGGL